MSILFWGKKNELRINIGGGKWTRKGWQVMDFPSGKYSDLKPDIEFDLWENKPFPFQNDSVQFFYSSHTLEHIPQEYCQHIFNEIYRCLKVGGAVRLTMPNFDEALKHYNAGDEDWFVKYRGGNIVAKFLDFFASYWRDKVTQIDLENIDGYALTSPRDVQREKSGNHINWWTYSKAKTMLKSAGFNLIYESAPQRSKCKYMRGKGRRKGFDSTHPEISMFVEAVK